MSTSSTITEFHRCPGCGRAVHREHFACQVCTRRLPYDIARRIRTHYRRDRVQHARAVDDASHWLRSHMGVRT